MPAKGAKTDALGAPRFAWRASDGVLIECAEKVLALNENQDELEDCLRNALEDGLALGVAASSLLDGFDGAVAALRRKYADKRVDKDERE